MLRYSMIPSHSSFIKNLFGWGFFCLAVISKKLINLFEVLVHDFSKILATFFIGHEPFIDDFLSILG